MYEFTESILIAAPVSRVWAVLSDIESWWLQSNPEHKSLQRLDDGPVTRVGARLRIREKVAGIPGEAEGQITRVDPGSAVTWEAPRARYRLLGLTLTVSEGVTWGLNPRGVCATTVSAHVWAQFPPGLHGRVVEWAFVHLLRGVDKDREHARTELRYLKRAMEEPSASG